MIRTLLLRQLRHHATLLAGAAIGVFAFEVLMVWIADSVDMGASFQELLHVVLPPAMVNLVLNQFGLASFPAAVAFGYKHPLVIASGATIMISLASIPAAERETRLLDLILARPLTRYRYISAHALLLVAAALLLPCVLLLATATGIALTGRGDDVAWHDYILPAAAFGPLLLLIGAYTLLFAASAERRGIAVARAAAITLAFYAYEVLSSMWERLADWQWLTIFHFFAPVRLVNGEAGAGGPLLLLGAALLLIALAHLRFQRQQL